MTAIAKALTILEVAGRNESAGIAELIEETGLPRSTLVRIVGELTARQFLERAERGRYRPGPKVRALAHASSSEDTMRGRARGELRRLVEATRETAHYAVYEAGFAVYVDKIDGSHPIRSYTQVGGRSPAYATATGKALLAWQDVNEIQRVARTASSFTRTTRTGIDAILAEERRVRALGYAVNRGEWRIGVWGIGVPVFSTEGVVVAAIGLSGPEQRIRPHIKSFAALLIEAAARVSAPASRSRRQSA